MQKGTEEHITHCSVLDESSVVAAMTVLDESKSFVKATCASRAFTLASRFRTKKSLSIQNLTYMMLKTRLPFLYASTSLDTKHQQLPRIVILKLYVDLLSCSSAHFAGFPFLPRVFPLPLATLLVIVTSSSTLH